MANWEKKCNHQDLQRLTGTLNFLTRAIFAGHIFTRRMYSKFANITNSKGRQLKHYHHVKLDSEFKSDCLVWTNFLNSAKEEKALLCRPFVDLFAFDTSKTIDFFSDASKNENLGFGVFYNGEWSYGMWEKGYIKDKDPSIEYLELFALCVGIFTWQHQLKNCRIVVHCDNQAVVSMVNKTTSSCKNCMVLLRLLILNGLIFNRRVLAIYIRSKNNILADSLSRNHLGIFWKQAPQNTKKTPKKIPPILWPLSKLWIN